MTYISRQIAFRANLGYQVLQGGTWPTLSCQGCAAPALYRTSFGQAMHLNQGLLGTHQVPFRLLLGSTRHRRHRGSGVRCDVDDTDADLNAMHRGLPLRSRSLCSSRTRRNYRTIPSLSLRILPPRWLDTFIWWILGNMLLVAITVLILYPSLCPPLGHITLLRPPTVTLAM